MSGSIRPHMAPSLISNPSIANSERSRRKRKKKSAAGAANQTASKEIKWKSDTQQQIYSSKLVQALSQLSITPSSSEAPRRSRAVREAADKALAFAAKGRTRWSRAILTNRLKLKFRKNKRPRPASVTGTSASRSARKPKVSVLRLKGKSAPAVQRKVKVLGRLVPGCRKESFPVILEEASDYIAALEMQVRAMSALADLLSGAGSSSSLAPPTSMG